MQWIYEEDDDGYQSANEKIRFIIRVQQDIFATPCVTV